MLLFNVVVVVVVVVVTFNVVVQCLMLLFDEKPVNTSVFGRLLLDV